MHFLARNRESIALDIGLEPEIGEKNEEEGTIDPNKMDENGDFVFTLFHEIVLRYVDRNQDELRLRRRGKMEV